MDISIYTCNKSETIDCHKKTTDPSVRPKVRKALRCAPKRCAPNRSDTNVGPTDTQTNDSLKVHKPLQRIPSIFRWRSSPDIVEESLKGMGFTISGTLKCLNIEDMVEMIEFCGGRVYKILAKKSNYLITGQNPSKCWLKIATERGKTVLTEQEFLDFVKDQNKQQKFMSYRQQTSIDEDKSDNESDICIISSDDD